MSAKSARARVRAVIARTCGAVFATITLAGCAQTISLPFESEEARFDASSASHGLQLLSDGKWVPSIAVKTLNPKFARQQVRYSTPYPVGTVVVDPDAKFLYLVMKDGYALRYGIGVGREGFGWSGSAEIARKAEWPTWTPPAAMIQRQPELARFRNGMAPGLDNPLGARALYLYQNGRDTLYRIHGTNEPGSIGENVSSGCIRLLNQDVVDLYRRVSIGSRVVVLSHGQSSPVIADSESSHSVRLPR